MRSFPTTMILLLSMALPVTTHAAWPSGGAPVCTATNNQNSPTVVSDGAGGAIITWYDYRNGTTADVYAQRMDASGTPLWTADGVALCTAANDQLEPKIVSDGAGGAIVTWYDYRSGSNYDIYAQRVSAAGVALWTPNGVALVDSTQDQVVPAIVSDGAGGAIVAWHDYRSAGFPDIYAQRVDGSGATQWIHNGVAICTATNSQANAMIATDGAGGAIITWEDSRGVTYDVYAQRVDASGVPQWTANGVAVCVATGGQIAPAIISDGAGGAILSWYDGRSGARGLYARRVSALGVPQWTTDGVAICLVTSASAPTIIPDGAGGAILAWYDLRSGTDYDIYTRKVDASGVPQWTANGVALCTAADNQWFPAVVSDGAGGAIVTWADNRNGVNQELYAQRVDASGAAQWTGNGILVSDSGTDKGSQTIVSDGGGGAIIPWADYRSGIDIYALRLNASGEVPTGVAGPTRVSRLRVSEVYPNPFSASAWMDVEVATRSTVQIDVFDVTGRRVRTMTLNGATSRRIEFDGRDNASRLLPSGVYFYRVKAAGETVTRKMVIAR